MKTVKISFPWPSAVIALILAGLFLLTGHSNLGGLYQIPEHLISVEYKIALVVISMAIVLWDIVKFYRQRKDYNETLNQLFKAKKQLQIKVHTYSGHSDKLKLFISERLLEYIQYDEKFLHFKNIAAEVRHNGVICFDKVQTALSSAITTYQADTLNTEQQHNIAQCQEALSSMRYLWDLLDLSTTDNIALHIGNHLCECEEHYFQSLLQKDTESPYKPTFYAHKVVLDCLLPSVETPDELNQISQTSPQEIRYSDPTFYIKLDTNIEMLGNENHLRLLIDNLINNAQFYAKKKHTAKVQKPIAIEISKQDNLMLLSVYNRGQHITNEDKDKIFQLGYSTRRKKENHGKGLGLYFANSIAQGYEGSIHFTNIHNAVDTYSIRIELDDGEIITEIVTTKLKDTLTMVSNSSTDELQKQIEWKFSSPIKSVEIFSKNNDKTYLFNDLEQSTTTFTDPQNPTIPTWSIAITKRKRSSILLFSPLDISGVKFQVSLPTAKARLDYSDDAVDTLSEDSDLYKDSYDNIIELGAQFKG